MEGARKIINKFLTTKYSGNELKSELFRAGEAACEEGWTYMDAAFQLGQKAQDDGLSVTEAEQILRRAFSDEKRSSKRVPERVVDEPAEEPAAQTQPLMRYWIRLPMAISFQK